GAAMLYGVPSMPAPVVGMVAPESAAAKAGIQPGDRIIAFDGMENPTWERVSNDARISPNRQVPITVDRGGQKVPLAITPDARDIDGNMVGDLGLMPDTGVEPIEIGTIVEGAPAAESGLQKG